MTSPGAPVSVTGVGVLTPIGDAPDAIFAALCEGRRAIASSSEHGGVGLASIADFEATKYTNVRGLRMYNRTTRLAICATRLALTDAKIDTATFPGDDLGVLMASTYGHLDVLLEYDRSLVANGVQRTNGALMPFAIPSAPGAMVALAFGAKAFSMTLSDGGSSSLDAIALGARWITEGRARACVVVSAFSASADVVRAISRAGLLASTGEVRPFDRRGTGAGLGEAAVAFVLERAEDAMARGAIARGTLRGYAATFATKAENQASALQRASVAALRSADVAADGVALVSASASGAHEVDRAEAEALVAALGAHASRVPVAAVKGALGETFDTAGALQALVALSAFETKKAPPIAGLEEPEVSGLRYATNEASVESGAALVTSIARNGSCSALVLSPAAAPGGDPS